MERVCGQGLGSTAYQIQTPPGLKKLVTAVISDFTIVKWHCLNEFDGRPFESYPLQATTSSKPPQTKFQSRRRQSFRDAVEVNATV